ncbi:MAG: NAD-dependent epimerase/dehydratase family protein [Sulfurifustis sp.]
MKIIVTGSSSPLAGALLPLFAADERIDQIIGLDRSETTFSDSRFTQVLLDLASPHAARVLAGADALVHLALAAEPDDAEAAPRDAPSAEAFYVGSAQNIFRAAVEQGVPRLVHLSSAVAYGVPARAQPIGEEHPRAALPGFAWAAHLVAFEEWLDIHETAHPETRVIRLRPHLIVGRRAMPAVRTLLRAPFSVRFAGRTPRLQCVHVDDVAQAILRSLERPDAAGAFNLACADAAPFAQMQQRAGGGHVPLPFAAAYQWCRLSRRFGQGADPDWLEWLRHDVVLDSSRARRRLDWRPRYDSTEACLRAAD